MINPTYVVNEYELNRSARRTEMKSNTFEEAVQILGIGKFHIFSLLVCGTAILPTGLLNSVVFFGNLLTIYFWGFMTDTWGRRKVMRICLLTSFVFSAISSFSINIWMMIATRFAVGLCVSGLQTAAIAYMGEFHSNKTRSKYVTLATMFMAVSIIYMSVLGWLIIPSEWSWNIYGFEYKPWRLFIFCNSLILLASFCGLLVMPESPKFMLAMGKKNEALDILRWVYEYNTGKSRENYPVEQIQLEMLGSNLSNARNAKEIAVMMWKQTKPLFQRPYVGNILRISCVTMFLFAVCHGFYMWYPPIINIYHKHMEHPISICGAIAIDTYKPNASLLVNAINSAADDDCYNNRMPLIYIQMIMGITFLVMYILVAYGLDRISRRLLMSTWAALLTIDALALVWAENYYLIQTLVVFLVSTGNFGAITFAISADLFPTCYKAVALCILMIAGRLGAIIGNNLIAATLFTNCSLIFYSFAGMLFGCVIIFSFLLKANPK